MSGFSLQGFLAVGVGAACGAWLRWLLQAVLNPWLPSLPLGTLAANVLGGLAVGFAFAAFERLGDVAPAVRLFVLTGFLGGFTTFSAFSTEVVLLLERREWAWAVATVGAHVLGAVAATAAGFALARRVFPAG